MGMRLEDSHIFLPYFNELQFLVSHVSRELAALSEIDSLEQQLLDAVMCGHQDGDPILTLKRLSTRTPSEYRTWLSQYLTHCGQQPISQLNPPGTTSSDNSRQKFCGSNEVITIVIK